MAKEFASSFRDALVEFLAPFQEAERDPQLFADWLATLGFTSAVSSDPALLDIVRHAQIIIENLSAFDTEMMQSWAGLTAILESGRRLSEVIQKLREFAKDPIRSHETEGLAEEVMALLLAGYLRRSHPIIFRAACLLTLVEPRETASLDPPLSENGKIIRYGRILDRFKFASLHDLILRPDHVLKVAYLPNNMARGVDAWQSAERLFPIISYLADALGIAWQTEYHSTLPPTLTPELDPDAPIPEITPGPDPEDPATPDDDESGDRPPPPVLLTVPDSYFATQHPVLRFTIVGGESADRGQDVSIEFLVSSREHQGAIPGYIVAAAGNLDRSDVRGPWKLTFSASGEVPAFVVGMDGLSRAPSDHPLRSGSAKFLLERIPSESPSGPAFLFGSASGTRLELGNFLFEMGLSYVAEQLGASISLSAVSGLLIVAPGDGDSFLTAILPSDGLRVDIDLGLTWSSEKGLALRGSAGLASDIPVGLTLGGVTLSTVHLSLLANDASISAEVSASINASIGPVQATVERIGVASTLAFPKNGGNFGVADVDVHFRSPNGIGLSIIGAIVTGGGFLHFDKDQGQYSGVVQLELQGGISVTGLGLIATHLPDGGDGFSLLVIITAENFKPIPLPLGFKLTRIGGLLAINRTFNEEALRAGLKSHTLANVLFPQDPIRNAPQILSNLNQVFPPAEGHHLFGPMATIEWGTPTLIRADVALILELGARLRLLILAQIVAVLPQQDNDLIRLQMDAVGVIDFDEGTAALDAVLYDSRMLKKFVLTGAMAMRLAWEGQPNFALAVGGLHPAFNPPPNFPKLERIAINFAKGDKLRFRCEAYYALTANTVQFGARAELYAEAADFRLHGEIGYDVLIQLVPFQFQADFYAQVQLKYKSINLLKVRVEGTLSGPLPLHIKAKATIEVLWLETTVRYDQVLVGGQVAEPAQIVDAFAALVEALEHPGNWVSRLPEGERQGVTLRPRPDAAGDILLHPLGTLTVKQTVAPLATNISHFGQAAPVGSLRFEITGASLDGQAVVANQARDFFAPAQFFTMSDAEKLSRPSFELMPAGVELGTHAFAFRAEECIGDAIEFDTIVVDSERIPTRARTRSDHSYPLSPAQLGSQAGFGAAANGAVRQTGAARYRTIVNKHRVEKEGWSIVDTGNLLVQPVPGIAGGVPTNYSAAEQALSKLKQTDPAAAAGLKILRLSEVDA